MTNDNAHGSLIGAVYEAGLNPGRWGAVVAGIRQAVDGEASILFHRDAAVTMHHCDLAGPSRRHTGHDCHGAIDPRSGFVAWVPAGRTHGPDRHRPPANVIHSEAFCDFCRPAVLGFAMAATLSPFGPRHGMLSVHRDRRAFSAANIACFEALAPHIARALQIHRQLRRAQDHAEGLALTLDHFPFAVLVVEATGGVLHMNARAMELLAHPGCPMRVVAGQLAAHDRRRAFLLAGQIRLAVSLPRGGPAPPVDLLDLPGLDGGASLAVMVAPLRGVEPIGLPAEPLAAVFISDPSQATPLDPQVLMQQFGLTRAEALLAAALKGGANLSAIAEARHISIETARTLLKRAMAKTDTHSQSQLVGRLGRSLALLRPVNRG